MKSLNKYLIGLGVTSLLVLSNICVYIHYNLSSAYEEKNITKLKKIVDLTHAYRLDYFAIQGEKLKFKLLTELEMEREIKKDRLETYLDNPLVALETVIPIYYETKWKKFYKLLDKTYSKYTSRSFQRIIKKKALNHESLIFKDLLDASKEVDFKYKEEYQAACGMYYISLILEEISFCTRYSVFDNPNQEKIIDSYIQSIETQMQAIENETSLFLSPHFLNHYEQKVIYSIQAHHFLLKNSFNGYQKSLVIHVNKKLYDQLSVTDKIRNAIPRPSNLKNLYIDVEEMIKSYTN